MKSQSLLHIFVQNSYWHQFHLFIDYFFNVLNAIATGSIP